jgi:hypothetical protein
LRLVPVGYASTNFNCTVEGISVGGNVESIPYFENFEGAQTWSGIGWTLGKPRKRTIKGAYSGSNAWVVGDLTANYDDRFERMFFRTPAFS